MKSILFAILLGLVSLASPILAMDTNEGALKILRNAHTSYLQDLPLATSSSQRHSLKKKMLAAFRAVIPQIDSESLAPDELLFLIKRCEESEMYDEVLTRGQALLDETAIPDGTRSEAVGPITRAYINTQEFEQASNTVRKARELGILSGKRAIGLHALVGAFRSRRGSADRAFADLADALLLDLAELKKSGEHDLDRFVFVVRHLARCASKSKPDTVQQLYSNATKLLSKDENEEIDFRPRLAISHAEFEIAKALSPDKANKALLQFASDLSKGTADDYKNGKTIEMVKSGLALCRECEQENNGAFDDLWRHAEAPFHTVYVAWNQEQQKSKHRGKKPS